MGLFNGQRGLRLTANPPVEFVAAGDGDQVRHHRRGGRERACSGAVVEGGAGCIAFNPNRVHHAVNARQQAVPGHQGGMHAGLASRLRPAGDGQVLNAVAQFLGVLQVLRRDVRDAFRVHPGKLKVRVKSQRRQDGQLVGGVNALHIKGGVGFGKAQFLRLGQRLGEGGALLRHRGQDVVGGAVDDAGQGSYAIGG